MSQTRSVLIRGVSFSYDSTTINKQRVLWYIQKDTNNYTQLYLDNIAKTFNYQKCINGTISTLLSNAETFSKYQVFNILCQQTSTGMKMSILKNNGTYETYSNTSTTYFEGTSSLYPLTKNATGSEADAFLDSIVYMPNQVFDDTQAESILRGTKEGFELQELFDIEKVTLHANATRANGVITLNATAKWQSSYLYIPVLPNNQYNLKYTQTATGTNVVPYGTVYVVEYYNNIQVSGRIYQNLTGDKTFITSPKTNKIKIIFDNTDNTTGTFTFSSVSLKMRM